MPRASPNQSPTPSRDLGDVSPWEVSNAPPLENADGPGPLNSPELLGPYQSHYDIDVELGFDQESTAFYPLPSAGDWTQLNLLDAELGGDSPSSRLAPLPINSSDKGSLNTGHSCRREAYEIFRDLICPDPSLHAPESNSATVSAPLDQVLHFTGSAVDRLAGLLGCPCARSGHRAMVHAAIVSRILIWYQQAAGWAGSSAWGPAPCGRGKESSTGGLASPMAAGPAADDAVAAPEATLVQATGFTVDYMPISAGSFNIEDGNLQAAFRNQLVLNELKKLASVIDMFALTKPGESGAAEVTSLYVQLGGWLRVEYRKTVDRLKSRLNDLMCT